MKVPSFTWFQLAALAAYRAGHCSDCDCFASADLRAFSLTMQAVQMGCALYQHPAHVPRRTWTNLHFSNQHTARREVHRAIGFRSSNALASAYGS